MTNTTPDHQPVAIKCPKCGKITEAWTGNKGEPCRRVVTRKKTTGTRVRGIRNTVRTPCGNRTAVSKKNIVYRGTSWIDVLKYVYPEQDWEA